MFILYFFPLITCFILLRKPFPGPFFALLHLFIQQCKQQRFVSTRITINAGQHKLILMLTQVLCHSGFGFVSFGYMIWDIVLYIGGKRVTAKEEHLICWFNRIAYISLNTPLIIVKPVNILRNVKQPKPYVTT